MRNYERDYIEILHARMNENFKGKCYCGIKNDVLIMSVTTEECGEFQIKTYDFSDKFLLGMNMDLLLYDFIMKYSKWITRKFIKC